MDDRTRGVGCYVGGAVEMEGATLLGQRWSWS